MYVESWLKSMDESVLRYVGDFKRLDFHNIKTIKFFNADDFDEFEIAPSTVHRRMIMNAVAKLQTPHAKLHYIQLAMYFPYVTLVLVSLFNKKMRFCYVVSEFYEKN